MVALRSLDTITRGILHCINMCIYIYMNIHLHRKFKASGEVFTPVAESKTNIDLATTYLHWPNIQWGEFMCGAHFFSGGRRDKHEVICALELRPLQIKVIRDLDPFWRPAAVGNCGWRSGVSWPFKADKLCLVCGFWMVLICFTLQRHQTQ